VRTLFRYFFSNKRSPVRELSGHQGFVGCVRFLDDKRVVSASGDHTNALWDMETGQLVTEFKEHKGEVMCIAVHPTDKNQFLSAASDSFGKKIKYRFFSYSLFSFFFF
jgi:guanine nucleotide-binding protein G(I)/G(S)/G(T) subunit beta-1